METAVVQRCAAGEILCGDDYAIVQEGSSWLLAVIDGLGHGPDAHAAARAARTTIEGNSGLGLTELVAAVGRDLRTLRGACLALARVDLEARRVSCLIVGNVEIVGMSQAPIRPLPSPGIVGRAIRKLRPFEAPIAPGDRLVFYSDGVSRRVDLASYQGLSPKETAGSVVRDFGLAHDDATCLVADVA